MLFRSVGEREQLEDAFEKQILDITNAYRVRFGVDTLVEHAGAQKVARAHSEDMGSNDYFEHVNLQGLDHGKRLNRAGITYRMAGENIAAGNMNGILAVEAWMNSKTGHRTNMLEAGYTSLGVGAYITTSGDGYYTQNFIK